MIIELQLYWGDREIYYIPELCSKIIKSMTTDGEVTLMTKEHRCSYTNGGFALLDSLCDFWKWDKSKITLITCNPLEKHPCYNIVFSYYRHGNNVRPMNVPFEPWTKEKVYGMFIGRPNAPRIRAVHNHDKFKFKHLGLTSFQGDLFECMDMPELIDYFMESNQTYQEMISIKPYSDIDQIRQPPITLDTKFDWGNIYKQIGIEIVCETSTAPNCFAVTEKLERCIVYRRPFLTIAPKGFNRHINSLNSLYSLKTFENYFNHGYDDLNGIQRVDKVFQILENLIETGKIYNILEDCKDDIEHNFQNMQHIRRDCNIISNNDKILRDFWNNK